MVDFLYNLKNAGKVFLGKESIWKVEKKKD